MAWCLEADAFGDESMIGFLERSRVVQTAPSRIGGGGGLYTPREDPGYM